MFQLCVFQQEKFFKLSIGNKITYFFVQDNNQDQGMSLYYFCCVFVRFQKIIASSNVQHFMFY